MVSDALVAAAAVTESLAKAAATVDAHVVCPGPYARLCPSLDVLHQPSVLVVVMLCLRPAADVGESFLTLFRVASLSGWSDITRAAMAVRGEDEVPRTYCSQV
jgi:hypothetical protein